MKNLKFARRMKDITQKELAEKVGVTLQTISYYERGKVDPTGRVIVKMADALDVTTDYLLGRE